MSYTTSQLQFTLSLNRQTIRSVQQEIELMRVKKKQADAKGDLVTEYAAHNYLRDARVFLKKMVGVQKATKAALKGQ